MVNIRTGIPGPLPDSNSGRTKLPIGMPSSVSSIARISSLIRFRVSETEAKFIRDLPIHKSKEEEGPDGKGIVFNIFVCPNDGLIMEFCKHGSRMEILSPKEVRQEVADQLCKAADLYR